MNDEDREVILDDIVAKIRRGDLEGLIKQLEAHSELVHVYHTRSTWLHMAATEGNAKIVSLLIELECDVNAVNGLKNTPLINALENDHPEVVRILLENGADPNYDRSVISGIVSDRDNSLEMVKLLYKHGADLHRVFQNEMSKRPMNALSEAVAWGKEDVAEYLRAQGCVLPVMPPTVTQKPETLAAEIKEYFQKNFGEVQQLAVTEIVPTDPSIAVNIIPATKELNHVTLFTTGMSMRPMSVPDGMDEFQYAELFIQLPGDWKPMHLDDPEFAWPVHWLRMLARAPHQRNTWLGRCTVIPNGAPPKPLTDNVKFDSLLTFAEQKFTSRDGRLIRLYRLMPIYPEERELVDNQHVGVLMRELDIHNIPAVVDLNRINVAT